MNDDEDPARLITDMDARLGRVMGWVEITEQVGRATLEQAARQAVDAMAAVADDIRKLDASRVHLGFALNLLDDALGRSGRSSPGQGAAAD